MFQNRVKPWLLECFGQKIADDITERNHPFPNTRLSKPLEVGRAVATMGTGTDEANASAKNN
jgi:hypothetical protein